VRNLTPLRLADVVALRTAGAQLLDVREPGVFAAGHLAGSVSIALSGKFATWAGTLLSHERPLVIVAEPGREREAVMRLGRIGYDDVAGYLRDGMAAVGGRLELVGRLARLTSAELGERLASTRPPTIVDVRVRSERQTSRIEPSLHVPLHQLLRRLRELPRDRELVTVCASGYRSCIAASLLAREGFDPVADLAGGMAAWRGNPPHS
jgi:hydroxyacylglutathione hydrolase